jgi:diguanylate cyclase (GGDEF)-like protein
MRGPLTRREGRLRLRLTAALVGIALVVLLAFGLAAYGIARDATLLEQAALMQQHVARLASELARGRDQAGGAPTLSELPPAQAPELLALRGPDGRLRANRASEGLSQRERDALLLRATSLASGGQGRFQMNGRDVLWFSTSVPGESLELLALRPIEPVVQSLATRLALAGFIVIWIAVWGALLVSGRITRRFQEQSERLAHQAMHDDLTGLPNRTLLRDRLDAAVRLAAREKRPQALLVMDLDRFKEVNDTLGHQAGDELLKRVSERLVSVLRDSDTPARLGGDEFAILLPNTGATGAVTCARKVLESLGPHFGVNDVEFEVATSIGIAVYPQHGIDVETLIQHADVAMYQAKSVKSGYALYAPEDDPHSLKRLTLSSDLRVAIEQNQFLLHFQPKVCLSSGQIVGAEALLRWQHPQRGFVPPDEFIPIAEQTGLISGLTDWVLLRSMEQSRAWLDRGIECSVAVNLSPHNVQDPHLAGRIASWLARLDLPPHLLRLELTETAAMSDLQTAAATFNELSSMGLQIAIDDFGTGMSSLAYLKRLPVSEIKIDKSFVIDMTDDENNAVIVRSIIDLSHNIGCKVVAEGVEDLATLSQLQNLGCDVAQGFYLSKPKPAHEVEIIIVGDFAKVVPARSTN